MNVILSIKPRFVERIKSGTKRYEFRKAIFKLRENVGKVVIYCSAPVKRLVGEFTVETILEGHPRDLWETCNGFSGIEKGAFFSYFKGKEVGFAIKIGDLHFFETPVDPRDVIPGFVPPQSFRYINEDIVA